MSCVGNELTMRCQVFRFLGAGLLALLLASASSHAAYGQIAVPAAGLSSSPGPLVGFLFMPKGRGPHPAVALMHGCGGAYAGDGSLNARHLML